LRQPGLHREILPQKQKPNKQTPPYNSKIKTNNSNKKCTKDMNRHFIKEEI
jgi:hypothetical protein